MSEEQPLRRIRNYSHVQDKMSSGLANSEKVKMLSLLSHIQIKLYEIRTVKCSDVTEKQFKGFNILVEVPL